MRSPISRSAVLLVLALGFRIPLAQASSQVDTDRLAQLDAAMTKAERVIESCERPPAKAISCAQSLAQELKNLDRYRSECAVRDSAQDLRRKIQLSVLRFYLMAEEHEPARAWFQDHFSVRPPTSNELFIGGPRFSDFVSQQLAALSNQGERKVHFDTSPACMIFVNGTEVDRDVRLPVGTYRAHTVNPGTLAFSAFQLIELPRGEQPLTVKIPCSVPPASIPPPPVQPSEAQKKPAAKPSSKNTPQRPPNKRPIKSDPAIYGQPTLRTSGPSDFVRPTPTRLLPLGYELAGLTAGLLGVTGGLVTLSFHGQCQEWLQSPTGPVCKNNRAWSTRPQSWVAIGVGSGVVATFLTLIIIDEIRTARPKKAQGHRAWRFQRGQVRF